MGIGSPLSGRMIFPKAKIGNFFEKSKFSG